MVYNLTIDVGIAGITITNIITRTATDVVSARPTVNNVIASFTIQKSIAIATHDCAVVIAGVDAVVALTAVDGVATIGHIANICINLAPGYLGSGDLAAGEHYAQLAMEQEEPEAMPYAYWCLGKIKAHQGNLPHAYACFTQVIRNGAQQPYIVAFAHKEEALLHLQQEQQAEGVRSLQKALQLFEKLGIQEEVAAVEALLNETMV